MPFARIKGCNLINIFRTGGAEEGVDGGDEGQHERQRQTGKIHL